MAHDCSLDQGIDREFVVAEKQQLTKSLFQRSLDIDASNGDSNACALGWVLGEANRVLFGAPQARLGCTWHKSRTT